MLTFTASVLRIKAYNAIKPNWAKRHQS